MYANIKDAYTSSSLPPLGRSDHNLIHLKPCYVPLVNRKPTTTLRTVRRWSEEAHEALQGCYEINDWPALCEPHGEDVDGLRYRTTGPHHSLQDTSIIPISNINLIYFFNTGTNCSGIL